MTLRYPFIAAALCTLMLSLLAGCGNNNSSQTNSSQTNSNHTASDNQSASATKTLSITGSSTVAPLVREIGKRYEKLHPNVQVNVQTGGSSRGLADPKRGLADIGMVSRALGSKDRELTGHLIARDGVTMIVHANNPVKQLTSDQIRTIYRGEVTNWQAVGGVDQEIVVVNKAEGRSTLEVFLKHFALDNANVKPSVIIGDNEQGLKTIAGNPAAIGYVSVGAAEYQMQQGVPVRSLPLNDVAATTENLAKGLFPLARELNLVTYGEMQPLTQDFIRFAQSSEVNDLIKDLSFVPVNQ